MDVWCWGFVDTVTDSADDMWGETVLCGCVDIRCSEAPAGEEKLEQVVSELRCFYLIFKSVRVMCVAKAARCILSGSSDPK